MTLGQTIMVGPLHFSVIRILIAIGIARVTLKREYLFGKLNTLDKLMIIWAVVAVFSSVFHRSPKETLIFHFGIVYNILGFYFLIRCFCQDEIAVENAMKMIAILLIPVAFEMLNEQLTKYNFFSIFGGVPASPQIRDGRLRSQGPFAHAILAGTVGAVCAPLMIGIWRKHPLVAKIGFAACVVIVVTSASSGPLMSLIFSIFALYLWRWRYHTQKMRIGAVIAYTVLLFVMKSPPYYLIARIDLTGSSTGWHRARLIQSAFEHLNEWWLAGTDYTRHWMPTGVTWSPDHADITNYYIQMGVLGGLPLMLLLIFIMWSGFKFVGQALQIKAEASFEDRFLIWSLGASLFAHAATCISVSYFDQSVLFLYWNLAVIASLKSGHGASKVINDRRE